MMATGNQHSGTPVTLQVEAVANFLVAYPPPVRRAEVPVWQAKVCSELGPQALPPLVELLEIGAPGEQYAAMAAARPLGAEVWATDREPNLSWEITLPGAADPLVVHPRRQAMPG
jgi:hypothetical protein